MWTRQKSKFNRNILNIKGKYTYLSFLYCGQVYNDVSKCYNKFIKSFISTTKHHLFVL